MIINENSIHTASPRTGKILNAMSNQQLFPAPPHLNPKRMTPVGGDRNRLSSPSLRWSLNYPFLPALIGGYLPLQYQRPSGALYTITIRIEPDLQLPVNDRWAAMPPLTERWSSAAHVPAIR